MGKFNAIKIGEKLKRVECQKNFDIPEDGEMWGKLVVVVARAWPDPIFKKKNWSTYLKKNLIFKRSNTVHVLLKKNTKKRPFTK